MKQVHLGTDWLELCASDGGIIRVRRQSHPRSRHLRLTVTAGGARVSCPRGTHPAKLFAFLEKHARWLEGKLAELKRDSTRLPPLIAGKANRILIGGQERALRWHPAPHAHLERRADAIVLHLPRPWDESSLARARNLLRDHLETRIRQDTARWLPRYVDALGRAPTALRIRVLRSLWGSLDCNNRISLDLSLALAPRPALRYVLVHELAHLAVRNHSPRFWRRVEALMPDYLEQRTWLRQHGDGLKVEIERLLG